MMESENPETHIIVDDRTQAEIEAGPSSSTDGANKADEKQFTKKKLCCCERCEVGWRMGADILWVPEQLTHEQWASQKRVVYDMKAVNKGCMIGT